jgi:hypothetical protein
MSGYSETYLARLHKANLGRTAARSVAEHCDDRISYFHRALKIIRNKVIGHYMSGEISTRLRDEIVAMCEEALAERQLPKDFDQ